MTRGFKKLDENAMIPERSTEHSAGYDISASETVTIEPEEMIKQDAQFGLLHYQPLEGMVRSKEKCQTCGKDFEVNHGFFPIIYPFCSIECWDNYTKYEGSGDE